MKKYLVLALTLMLTFAWVWAGEEDVKDLGYTTSSEQLEAKWQPEYGPKGDLLNPEPVINFSRSSSGEIPEPPVIATNLVTEDFEGVWDCQTPPAGWTIIDNGNEGHQCWYNQDWHKYYYSSWSDTVARMYYSPNMESTFDEWLISPDIILPGGAVACSLTWDNYYNDRTASGRDSAFIKITTDGGSNWIDLLIWDEDHGGTTPSNENVDITTYDGNTVKVAFVMQCFPDSAYNKSYYWYLDKVNVWADASSLLFEDFNNWGPGGDNPPSGWTIIDNGTPNPGQAGCNNNDFYQYTAWGSSVARVYYTSSYREWQDEWMISPSFSITAGAVCTLTVSEYYYHTASSAPWGLEDHGYILITTDGGSNWITIYDNDVTKGSSSTENVYQYDISAYAGNTCQVAFNFINSPYGSDYWYLDNVSVDEFTLPAHDVMTSAINSPLMGIEGMNLDISVDVTNVGLNTETFDDSTRIWLLNSNTLLYENFSNPQGWTGANPPQNIAGTWAVIDSGDEATPVWNNNDWHAYYYSTWSDTIARVYYYTSPYENMNEWLITPSLDMSTATDVHLTFKHFYNDDTATETDTAWVLISTDDFAHVNVVAMYTVDQGTSSAPLNPDYDISAWAAGWPNVKIAFKYVGYAGYYWYLDNVEIYELLTPTLSYTGGETVTALTSLETRTVDYTAQFTDPDPGDYMVESFTKLATDEDNSNDTLTSLFTVYPHYDSGGPDAGNYHWVDNLGNGPAYSWIDISTIGTRIDDTLWISSVDDGYVRIPMGMSFTFYDVAYDSITISTNGWASPMPWTSSYYSNTYIPNSSDPDAVLAVLWDDHDGGTVGSCYYYYDATENQFIISWEDWPWYPDPTDPHDFQIILDGDDRSIKYQYGPGVYQTDLTIGIENGDGSVGLEYYYNESPFGNSPFEGLAITFRYVAPAIDAALASIDEPLDGSLIDNGTTVTPTITVLNNSDNAYTVPVTFLITDGTTGDTVYNQSETTALISGGGGTLQHAFTTTWNADPDGDYDMETYTSLPGDANPANDTATGSFEVAQHHAQGGPDDYGYRWIDNYNSSDEDPPVYNWIDISTIGTEITAWTGSVDDGYYRLAMGTTFEFYGIDYDSVTVSTNGWVCFLATTSSYLSNSTIPNTALPNGFIGPLWDDQDGGTVGHCYYYYDATENQFIVSWVNWPWYPDPTDPHDFQVILDADNNQIVCQYGPGVYQTDITIGIEDETGSTGLEYYYNGDPVLNAPAESLAIKFYLPVFAHDARAREFIVPATGLGMTNVPITPEVLFDNNGTNDETNVPVYLYIDPGAYADTQTIAVLDSGTSFSQQFAQFTPTSSGVYTLTAVCDLAGDEDPASDTLVMSYQVFDGVFDFESGPGPLIASGGSTGNPPDFNGDWEWGIPYGGTYGPATAHSPTHCWGMVLDGPISTPGYSDTCWSIIDFQLDVGTANNAVLGYYEWNGLGTSYYDSAFVIANGDTLLVFNGNNEEWHYISLDLSAYTGIVDMRFYEKKTRSGSSYDGWYFDDFTFTNCEFVLGAIDGTVTDANTTFPVEGAEVRANGMLTDVTDINGYYNFDFGVGDVEVEISKFGYDTDTDTVTVVNGQTTTHNVVLNAPIVYMDASPVVDTVTVGDTAVYSRYVYNNGTAPLIYSVALDFSGGGDPLSIRSNTVSERIASFVDPDGNADAAPFRYNSGNLPIITAFQDSVACVVLDSATDTQFLGVEFDGTYFWATGGNSGGEPNKLYKYDVNGVLLNTYDQSSAAGWGWRDLAWDGAYLYGSDSYDVVQIDPATGMATGVTITGPSNPARALAWDPDTDHFWTASFSSSIWEFGRDGTVHNTFSNTKAIYGMAWDDVSDDGPWLWVFSQDGPGVDTLMEISQFDPDSGVYTGVSFQGAIPDGYVGSIAGGACFTTEFDPSVGALFVLGQGNPTDFIYGYEITPNVNWFLVQSGGSGEVAVDDSALIEFLVDFRDSTIVVDSTYEADANINTNDPYPPEWNPQIQFSITAGAAGCDYVTGDVNGSDSYNGLDITYGVAYFKGGPDPMCPYGTCPIPPCDAFFYCGDVNGSCSYNGLDITYGVAYFKGGPGPIPCPSCPPVGGPATIGNELRPTVQPAVESKSKLKKGNLLDK